jgi:hypothetical protein
MPQEVNQEVSDAERAFTLFDNFIYTDAENLVGLACKQAAVSSDTVSSGLKDTISAISNAELRELEEITTVRTAFATAFSRDTAPPSPPVCMYTHTHTHTHTQASVAKRAGAEAPLRNAAPAGPPTLSKGKSKYVRQLENYCACVPNVFLMYSECVSDVSNSWLLRELENSLEKVDGLGKLQIKHSIKKSMS